MSVESANYLSKPHKIALFSSKNFVRFTLHGLHQAKLDNDSQYDQRVAD